MTSRLPYAALALALAVQCPALALADGKNLLPHNAGFEVGVGGWRWYGTEFAVASPGSLPENRNWIIVRPEVVTGDAAEGLASLRLVSSAKQCRLDSLPVAVEAGKKYTLSASVKGSANEVLLAFASSDWNLGIASREGEARKVIRPTGQWTRHSLSFTPKENLAGIAMILVANGTVQVDAVKLEQGDLSDYSPTSTVEVDGAVDHPFALLEVGAPSKCTVQAVVHGGRPRPLVVEWTLEDHALAAVAKGKREIKMEPGSPQSFTLPVDTKRKGGFRLVLRAEDVATKASDWWPVVYAVIAPPVEGVDPRESPFGSTSLVWGGVGAYRAGRAYASLEDSLELMRRCGIHGTREEGMGGGIFGGVSSSKTKPDYEKADYYLELIDAMLAKGIIPLPYVPPVLEWSKTGQPYASQSRYEVPREEDMRFHAERIAKAYRGRIPVYETFWETESWATPENMAKVAPWVVQGLKKGDPSCKVVGICPTFDPAWADPAKAASTWLGRALPLVRGVFDGFTTHLYAGPNLDDPPPGRPSYRAAVSGMNRLLEQNGMPPGAFADTESDQTGASMYSPYIKGNLDTVRRKCDSAVRQMVIGLSLGIQRQYWFTFLPHEIAGECISLFGWNMTPDPVVGAWTQMAQRLEGAKFREWLDRGALQVYLFDGRDQRPFAIYWHLSTQDGASLELPLEAASVKAEDLMGNPVTPASVGKGISLPVSGSARYLVLQKGGLPALKKAFDSPSLKNVRPRVTLASLFGDSIPSEIVATATAFNTVMERLKQAKPLGPLAISAIVKGALFSMPDDRAMAMVWLDKSVDGVTILLPSLEGKLEAVDIYGKTVPPAAGHAFPLTARPLTLLGKGISAEELKRAVEKADVDGLVSVKVGRISVAAVGEERALSLVTSVRNEEGRPISGTVRWKGLPPSWGVREAVKFGPIERGREQLVAAPFAGFPRDAHRVPIAAEVVLDNGMRFPLAPRTITIIACRKAPNPITLDGQADDSKWGEATWHELSAPDRVTIGAKQWKGPADSSMKFAVQWYDRGFYMAFKVKDDVLRQQALPSLLYQQDDVEAWLDVATDKNLFDQDLHAETQTKIDLAPKGGGHGEERKRAEAGLYPLFDLFSAQLASRKTADGWEMEVKIPCTKEDLAGRVIGFELALDDADADGLRKQMVWSGDGQTFKDTSRWAFLVFQ